MSLHPIPKPPRGEMLDFPTKGTWPDLCAPDGRIFLSELDFWRETRRNADKAGRPFERRIAMDFEHHMRELLVGRYALQVALDTQPAGLSGEMAEGAMEWYADALGLLAYSRMLQTDPIKEAIFSDESTFAFNADVNTVCLTYNTDDIEKAALFWTKEGLSELGLAPNTWYEGEDIFVHVRRTPQPAKGFLKRYQAMYNQPFDTNRFASIQPRLKRAAWETEAD